MITYHTFLANIFSLCEFIVSDHAKRAWVNGETGVTSVVSPEELFEMEFGDNDLENMLLHFSTELKAENIYMPVANYRDSLTKLEAFFDANPQVEPRLLLASKERQDLRSAAEQVAILPPVRTAFQQTYGR